MPLIGLYASKGKPGRRPTCLRYTHRTYYVCKCVYIYIYKIYNILYIYMIYTHKIWYDVEEHVSALGNITLSRNIHSI